MVLIWIVLVGIVLGSEGWIELVSIGLVLTSDGWIEKGSIGLVLTSEGWIEMGLGRIVLYRIESVLDRFGVVDEGPSDMVVLVWGVLVEEEWCPEGL